MQGSDNNNRLDRLVYLVNHLRHYQKLADFDKKALRMAKKYEAMVDEFLSEQRVMELPFNGTSATETFTECTFPAYTTIQDIHSHGK